MLSINYPFENQANYITDLLKLEFAAGKCQNKAIDLPDQEFIEDFADDTDFVYDSAKAEFVAGQVQQKDQRPGSGATFGANFNTDINGSWGDGVLTGTPAGGAAVVGGKLDLGHDDIRYVDYDAAGNADSIQTGCFRFTLTPKWSGNPSTWQSPVYICKADNDDTNHISLALDTSGDWWVYFKTVAGVYNGNFGQWNPTADQEYEFELNYDLTTGEQRLFIDGVQFGSTKTIVCTRSNESGLLRLGNIYNGSTSANFLIDDFVFFDTVQHTVNYVPGYIVPDYTYAETNVILPEMEYTGVGTLQVVQSLVTIENGLPRYTIQMGRSGDYLYWDGADWVVSDGTYSQANDIATMEANASSLDIAGKKYGQFKLLFTSSNSISDVDNLIATLTGQAYSTDELTIKPVSSFMTDDIESLALIASSSAKIVFIKNGSMFYHDGNNWVSSDGSLSQANTIAELTIDELKAFTDVPVHFEWMLIIKSDGTVQEYVDYLSVGYNFAGEVPTVTTCTVWSYFYDLAGNPLENEVIKIAVKGQLDADVGLLIDQDEVEVKTDSTGYWEQKIVYKESNLFPTVVKFEIDNKIFYKKLKYQASASFDELEEV